MDPPECHFRRFKSRLKIGKKPILHCTIHVQGGKLTDSKLLPHLALAAKINISSGVFPKTVLEKFVIAL